MRLALQPAPPGFYWRVLVTAALTFLGVFLAISAFVTFFSIGIPLQSSTCLPYRAFLLVKQPPPMADIRRGDILGFIPPLARMGELGKVFAGHQVVKQVAGLPGDLLIVKGDAATVSGHAIGTLDLLDRLGKPPGSYDRIEKVPPGHLLMIGTLPRSYDGRYWGVVPYENVVSRAYPLL